jgi:RNA polymerase sigma-70 factor (ECF subfamily)
MDVSDEVLMERVQGGDAAAFDLLVQRHGRALLNFIYRYVGDWDRAEDLLQDTYLRLLESAASFRPDRRFTTWIYRVAANRCVDELRQLKHRQHVSLDGPVEDGERPLAETLPDDGPTPEEIAVARDTQRLVRKAIRGLPDEQRAALVLKEYQGLSYQEIAAVLGCPLGTVKSRLHHAMRNLRAALQKEWG